MCVCTYVCLSACVCVCKHMYAKMKHTHDQENHFSLRKKTMRPFCQEIAIRAVARFSSNPKRVASAVAWEAQPSPAQLPSHPRKRHRTASQTRLPRCHPTFCRIPLAEIPRIPWVTPCPGTEHSKTLGGTIFHVTPRLKTSKPQEIAIQIRKNILKVPSFWCFQSLVSSGKFGSLRESLAASTLSSTRTEEKSRPTWQRKLEVTKNRQQNGS